MAWLVMGIWRAKGWTTCKSYISRRRKHGSYSEKENYDRKRTIQRQIQSNVADRATSGGWKSTDDFHLRKISWNFRLWYTWEEIAGYDPHSNNLYIEGLKDFIRFCMYPTQLSADLPDFPVRVDQIWLTRQYPSWRSILTALAVVCRYATGLGQEESADARIFSIVYCDRGGLRFASFQMRL